MRRVHQCFVFSLNRHGCAAAAICLLLATPVFAQPYRYSADGSEVTDSKTGLIWRRCSEGQTWNGSTCAGTALAYTHEQALVHAQTQDGWRLPNVKELTSIVDRSRSIPAIDPTAFPATSTRWYWTSSPDADRVDVWMVGFYVGYVSDYSRGPETFYVRLVR